MKLSKKTIGLIEIALIGGAIIATILIVSGCQGIKGFQYANNGAISSSEARNAAAMARAEANALDAIAAENDATAHRVINTAGGLVDDLGIGGIGGIGAAIGALSTLWVKPPRRKKKVASEDVDTTE